MSNKMRVLTFPRDEFHNPRDNSQTVSSRIIITVETAREFASTSNNCTVTLQTWTVSNQQFKVKT